MSTPHETGRKAEELALVYLKKLGYKILNTNWHHGHLELDIVAKDNDELVIVEVKSRTGQGYEHPSEALTDRKIRHIVDAADAYVIQKDLDIETRFDLITVVFMQDEFELEHFKDAFFPTL